jgi:hypothetical protein
MTAEARPGAGDVTRVALLAWCDGCSLCASIVPQISRYADIVYDGDPIAANGSEGLGGV